ncbi:uncharacterized protein LOC123452932 isoform X2 [Hordeum vulgare subsp. vulgare]|uniref:uncharacterized protein LOC123452932 isoform X2 n=1 Tax=Hordeum vulgare subsp. vulgare TaxID=112509 RepID=UPI001D1A485C|nr:uncharacterized protein LOC123452932 isoform X2 [Hordeum vulgare subsp. vulgare]
MVVWTSMAVAGQRSMMADVVGMPHSAYHELRIKTMAADEQSLLVEEVAASVGKGSFGRAGGVQDRVEIQRPEVRLRRGRRYRTRRIPRKIIASRLVAATTYLTSKLDLGPRYPVLLDADFGEKPRRLTSTIDREKKYIFRVKKISFVTGFHS